MACYRIYKAAYKVYRRAISGRVYETQDLHSVGHHYMVYPEVKTAEGER